jgi:hypothetical protein
MAPKKRPATTPKKTTLEEPPMILLPEVLADLRYLEPARTRNRVISALNEAFLRIQSLERLHQEPAAKKRP